MIIKIEPIGTAWQIRTVDERGATWFRGRYKTPGGALRAVTRLQGKGHHVGSVERLAMLLYAGMRATCATSSTR